MCGWGHDQDVCRDGSNLMMQGAVQARLNDLTKKEKDLLEKMENLKTILYGRFGSSINLEA